MRPFRNRVLFGGSSLLLLMMAAGCDDSGSIDTSGILAIIQAVADAVIAIINAF